MRKLPDDQKKKPKPRVTICLTEDVLDRLRDAVYNLPGESLFSFSEAAIIKHLDKAEKSNGGPFKKRKKTLRGDPL